MGFAWVPLSFPGRYFERVASLGSFTVLGDRETDTSPATRPPHIRGDEEQMKSTYWIKLYLEMLDDPKMGRMNDRLYRRTVETLLFAGEMGDGGFLPTLEDMSWRLRTTPEQLETDLIELSLVGILSFNDVRGRWFVNNFAERQKPSSAAERMRRYRKRNKQNSETETETDTYSYVTGYVTKNEQRNENVTFRNGDPETDDDAINVVLDLQEFWLNLTGGSLPTARDPRINDYFVPLNRLLIRVDWNSDAAAELLKQKRAEMLANGKTPYRPAAIVPRIIGDLDAADNTYSIPTTTNVGNIDRLNRIMAMVNQ